MDSPNERCGAFGSSFWFYPRQLPAYLTPPAAVKLLIARQSYWCPIANCRYLWAFDLATSKQTDEPDRTSRTSIKNPKAPQMPPENAARRRRPEFVAARRTSITRRAFGQDVIPETTIPTH